MIGKPTRFVTALLLAATPLSLLALIAPSAPLFAGEGRHRRPFAGGAAFLDEGRMERHVEHQAERLTLALDLTAEQQATLARLQDELEATIRPLAEGMRTAHQQLRTLLAAESPDPATVGAQAIALDRARDSMHAAHESFEASFADTLTASQRTTFHALQEMRPEGERFGGPFAGRRGPAGQGQRPRR